MDNKDVTQTGGWVKNEKYNPPDSWIEGREDAIDLIREERRKQFIKWGLRKQDDGTWLKILTEEIGEVAQAMLNLQFPNYAGISLEPENLQEELRLKLRKEITQVAAVACAMIQQLDKGEA
jgi:NTP pyrophosphatase (non-canonical NTP hydrolase)